jgi:hypothetical protein
MHKFIDDKEYGERYYRCETCHLLAYLPTSRYATLAISCVNIGFNHSLPPVDSITCNEFILRSILE